MDLSVVAYNIHYGKKLELIRDWLLAKRRFDIICLQEFPIKKHSEFLELFASQGYKYCFAPSFIRRKTQYGELTLFDTKKIKLIHCQSVELGSSLLEDRFIENRFRKTKGQKSSLLTLFKYKNKKLVLANSHLLAFALNSRRLNQLNKIMSNVDKIGDHTKYSTVILGDFNYTSIIRQKKLIDFMTQHEFKNAYKTHTHKLFFLGQQLDYVFHNNCSIKKVKVDRIKYSDHYPVQFKIEL
jgi:endonuclease/exonuclease/phosphatase family metal-dependent hydrolase